MNIFFTYEMLRRGKPYRPYTSGCGGFNALNRQRGFTLIELIIVMAIVAIIAALVAIFIRMPVQGYIDSAARAEMTDVADTALRRIARDLRLALPNSTRVPAAPPADGNTYLELLLTKTGGRYLADDDIQTAAGSPLSWDPSTPGLTFTVVGTLPAAGSPQAIVAGDSIVVYNMGPGFDPADAYNCTGVAPTRLCNRATVTSVSNVNNTITIQDNPFVNQSPSMKSPVKRFQVVTTPVTYVCNPTLHILSRYDGYAIQAAQPVSIVAAPLASVTPVLVANNVKSCVFNTALLQNTHSALLSLTLTLGVALSATDLVVLSYQVHVDNTP